MAFNFGLNLKIVGDVGGVDISNLDFEYKFTRSTRLGESSCNITVYNLNEDTKNMVQGTNVSIALQGGWLDESNPLQLPDMFRGNVISTQEDNSDVDKKFILNCTNLRGSFKDPVSKKTKEASVLSKKTKPKERNVVSFRKEWENLELNISYDVPTTMQIILTEISSILGCAMYGVEQTAIITFPSYSDTGKIEDIFARLNAIMENEKYALKAYIDLATLQVYNKRVPIALIPLVHFSDSPLENKGTLINVSKIVDKTTGGDKSEEKKERLQIDCIYHPSLVPNGAVTLNTKIAKGAYLINKITASGSTWTDANLCTLEVSSPG